MNSREKLTAISRGGPVDRPPWFAWDPRASYPSVLTFAREWEPDAVVAKSADDAAMLLDELGENGPAILAEVRSPFSEAMADGINLNLAFANDPSEAETLLTKYFMHARETMAFVMDTGCDGILYRLSGASPEHSTPMQYGGYYLERDRELLEEVSDARFNVLYVAGGKGTYLDVVADIPAAAFAWDEEATGVTPREVRKFRKGALACGLFGDHRALWEEFGGSSLVFFAATSILPTVREEGGRPVAPDFSVVKRACDNLRSPVPNE